MDCPMGVDDLWTFLIVLWVLGSWVLRAYKRVAGVVKGTQTQSEESEANDTSYDELDELDWDDEDEDEELEPTFAYLDEKHGDDLQAKESRHLRYRQQKHDEDLQTEESQHLRYRQQKHGHRDPEFDESHSTRAKRPELAQGLKTLSGVLKGFGIEIPQQLTAVLTPDEPVQRPRASVDPDVPPAVLVQEAPAVIEKTRVAPPMVRKAVSKVDPHVIRDAVVLQSLLARR